MSCDGLYLIDRMSKIIKSAIEEYNVGVMPLLCSNTVDDLLHRSVEMNHLGADKYFFRIVHLSVLGRNVRCLHKLLSSADIQCRS